MMAGTQGTQRRWTWAAMGLALATTVSACAAGVASGVRPGAVNALAATSRGLQLVVEPDAGVAPVVNAINAAKQSIHMKMYLMTEPSIIAALSGAAKRLKGKTAGPAVQVILEHWTYDFANPDVINKIFNKRQEDVASQLKAGGVTVQWAKNLSDPDSGQWFNLTHEKSMVIDGGTPAQSAWIMTANMTSSAFGGGEFGMNREYLIRTTNPDQIAYTDRLFQADWDGKATRESLPSLATCPSMGFMANNGRAQLIRLVDSATKSLTIQVEVFNDQDFMVTLGQLVKRGVAVRVTLDHQDPRKPGEPEPDGVIANALAAQGVKDVRFSREINMHAKAFVADGVRAYVGSINLTRGSLDKNRELGVMTDDPSIVTPLARTEAADWAKSVPAPNTKGPDTIGFPGAPKTGWVWHDQLGS